MALGKKVWPKADLGSSPGSLWTGPQGFTNQGVYLTFNFPATKWGEGWRFPMKADLRMK